MKTPCLDSQGMSLIEVIIALGITSVLFMAMTDMFQGQARETQALSEKLAALDFQRTVEGAISVAASCGKNLSVGNLAPGQSLTFDSNGVTSTDKNNPTVIAKLQKVYGMDGVTVLADSTAADRTVSSLSANVKLHPESGLQLAAYKDPTSGQLVYKLLLGFDGATLVRPIRNLAMTVNATSVPAGGTSVQVTGCIGASVPVVPPVASGTLCGNRLVSCSGGPSPPAYDGNLAGVVVNMKSSNVPCQGVTLTADCSVQYIDGSHWTGSSSVMAVHGCPSGWSGGHTPVGCLSASTGGVYDTDSPGVSFACNPFMANAEIGYIYCKKD